jgi:2-desacetyl-2-hydroxyethyl bacteriochlorophyllide A dehydrogenase
MRAAVYTSKRSIQTFKRPVQPPRAGEVRIDVAYTGVCGTDLHIFHGDMDGRVAAPAVVGHEMSGRVAELGSGVTGWSVGDPVTVMPLQWDGTCPACVAGNEHICQNLNFIGIDSPGAMQQSWTVPASTLVALPVDLPLEHAALVEPTAVAVHDVRRAAVSAGDRVVVVGGGPVGLLIALVARDAGGEVMVAELNPFRRSIAEAQGLRTVDPAQDDVSALVQEWTEGAGAAIAFEVSGAAAGVALAVDVLAVRGRLCLVAIHPVPREVSLHRFFWRELTLVGARLYRREDFVRAIELIATNVVPSEQIISRVVGLDAAADAFEALESGGGVMKVLVDCRTS